MTGVAIRIEERALPSGLTLLAVCSPGVSTGAASLVVDVDVRDEMSGEAGLANLVGECLDEGTARRSGFDLAEELDRIGTSLDASASGASVCYPAEAATQAIELMSEVAREPSFPQREVDRVQQEVLAEIKADADDPRTVAGQRFRKRVYGSHPYGRSTRGTEKTVASFDPDRLRDFHARMFVPQRAYLAIAGPDEPARSLDRLEAVFGDFAGAREPRERPAAPELPAEVSDEHLPMKREQVHVYLGHPGIRRADPDFIGLSVMDHILGTGPGFTSRIAKRLRDEEGLCYSVDASITSSARDEPGCFTAYIGTSPQHRDRAIEGFREQMRLMRETVPEAQELADVQEYLTGSFVWQLERNAALVRYAIRAKHYGLGFDYIARYPQMVRSITREEVQRVAREHLHPDRVVIVSAGAESAAD